jgi:hypothetical protein
MSAIRFYCKACGGCIKTDAQYAGRRGECPRCQTPFAVPQISEPLRPEPQIHEPTPAVSNTLTRVSTPAPDSFPAIPLSPKPEAAAHKSPVKLPKDQIACLNPACGFRGKGTRKSKMESAKWVLGGLCILFQIRGQETTANLFGFLFILSIVVFGGKDLVCPQCGLRAGHVQNWAGTLAVIALLIVGGIASAVYFSSSSVDSPSARDSSDTATNAPPTESHTDIPATASPQDQASAYVPPPTLPLPVDITSVEAFAKDLGMEPQDDKYGTYASGSYISEQGRPELRRPFIVLIFGPAGMRYPSQMMISVDGPTDWHNDILSNSIRFCCGADVLNRLMIQTDNYLARSSPAMQRGGDFTEGEFSFSYVGGSDDVMIMLTITRAQ